MEILIKIIICFNLKQIYLPCFLIYHGFPLHPLSYSQSATANWGIARGGVLNTAKHTMSLKFYWKLPKFSSIFIWNKIYFISGSNEAAQIDKILLQGILMKIIFDKMQKDRIKQELWMFTWGRNN